MDNRDIFKNLKVVELATVLAGPAVGMFFSELGAEVIKIENKRTAGDVTRGWKLPQEDPSSSYSAYYHSTNWNKQSLLLDLTNSRDNEQALSLISEADIVITNFRGQSGAKLGMDYANLSKQFPGIIYGAITTYGESSDEPGFDVMIQAETGWIFMTGEPQGNPVKMPVALMDILAAHQLKEGILVALLQRERDGKGAKVSVSLFDAGMSALANQASNWLNVGVIPQRKGSQHPNIAPYGDIFYTQDDKPILLAVGTEKQFHALCKFLRLAEIPDNPSFSSNAQRVVNRESLIAKLKPAFQQIPLAEVLEGFKMHGVPAAAIHDMQSVFESPLAKYNILEGKSSTGEGAEKGFKTVRTATFRIER